MRIFHDKPTIFGYPTSPGRPPSHQATAEPFFAALKLPAETRPEKLPRTARCLQRSTTETVFCFDGSKMSDGRKMGWGTGEWGMGDGGGFSTFHQIHGIDGMGRFPTFLSPTKERKLIIWDSWNGAWILDISPKQGDSWGMDSLHVTKRVGFSTLRQNKSNKTYGFLRLIN